ncbi:uncharacterized protein [Watersipora subatra]|uniref:uncharacterized protein n=1 Tax=Watersipora subatra TaxID=2589382 RepID=UPI00355C452D
MTAYLSSRLKSSLFFVEKLKRGICAQSSSLLVHEPVRLALETGKPVVALESTILTHGMPFPDNLRMARAVERIIKEEGAEPATIALISGSVHVGLEGPKLQQVAEAADGKSTKVSRRDIAYALNEGLVGGTTISATMFLAHKVGIKLFVSGGLGGVHRGGELSMDVSADLTQLGRTPVALVTSGVKSILDIGRTLEYLETLGVCVATYGVSKEFPAFFSRESGHSSACNVSNIDDAARLVHTTFSLGRDSGLLIANPIPEEHEIPAQRVEQHIQKALTEIEVLGLEGKQITPYILKRVNELTDGQSLKSNIALVENNARLGAKIAVRLAEIEQSERLVQTPRPSSTITNPSPLTGRCTAGVNRVSVVGACNVDTILHIHTDPIEFHGQTNHATSSMRCGGVGRNLCDGLTRLGTECSFLSALGADLSGDWIVDSCQHMDWTQVLRLPNSSTAQYSVVLNSDGGVVLGIGDMNIHEQITPEYVMQNEETLVRSAMIVMDSNLSVETISAVGQLALAHHIPVFYDPTDTDKACKVFSMTPCDYVTYLKPNTNEFREIYAHLLGKRLDIFDTSSSAFISYLSQLCLDLSHIPCMLVTLGAQGVLLCINTQRFALPSIMDTSVTVIKSNEKAVCLHMKAPTVDHISSVSGAGDSMAAGFIHAQLRGFDVVKSLKVGTEAASRSLMSYENIPASLGQLSSLDLNTS